ncbi:MAG: hypothetical protein J0H66_07440 [Solirubrobacterales bacterium]|nr:hypothetical protein [Solirubrobacterales bacterium]OJU93214.1 MAG: hypothetical protein BGO23_10985 [Solirubrobacterales bacterium 67-14]
MNRSGGVFGALIFVIGILLAFAVMFGFFLIVPFFIFLAGVIVMLVSDRRDRGGNGGGSTTTVETVETTEVVREVKS